MNSKWMYYINQVLILVLLADGCMLERQNKNLVTKNETLRGKLDFYEHQSGMWRKYGFQVDLPAHEATKGVMTFWFNREHIALAAVMFEMDNKDSEVRTNYALDSACVCPIDPISGIARFPNGVTLEKEEMTMYGISVTDLLDAQESGAYLWDNDYRGLYTWFTGTSEDIGLSGVCMETVWPRRFIENEIWRM